MKKCKKCHGLKPLSKYRTRSGAPHLYQSWCKECERKGMTSYQLGKGKDVQVAALKKYKASQKGQDTLKRSIEVRNKKFPERVNARTLVSRALKSGSLVKWPVCALPDCCASDVEAHHPDYSNPLDVVWLCTKHHLELHSGM